jgi:hypothetical protein
MGGLPYPELDISSQNAVVNVTAWAMNIPVNTVRYVDGIASAENRRRLGSGISLFSTTYKIVAITAMTVPLSATPYNHPSELYSAATAQLQQAVYSGAFSQELIRVSVAFNASMLASVNVTSASPSPAVVTTPSAAGDDDEDDGPAPNSDSSASLSSGAVAGIVIGSVFGAVLLALFVYYMAFVKNGLVKVADAGRSVEVRQLAVVPA